MKASSKTRRITGLFIVFFFSILNLGLHALHREHGATSVGAAALGHHEAGCHCRGDCLPGEGPSLRPVRVGVPGHCPACDLLRNFNVPGVSSFASLYSLGIVPEKTHLRNETIGASSIPIFHTARSPPPPSPTIGS